MVEELDVRDVSFPIATMILGRRVAALCVAQELLTIA